MKGEQMLRYAIALMFLVLSVNAQIIKLDNSEDPSRTNFKVSSTSSYKAKVDVKIETTENGSTIDITDLFSVVGQGYKVDNNSEGINISVTDLSGKKLESYLITISMLADNQILSQKTFQIVSSKESRSYSLTETLKKNGLRKVQLNYN